MRIEGYLAGLSGEQMRVFAGQMGIDLSTAYRWKGGDYDFKQSTIAKIVEVTNGVVTLGSFFKSKRKKTRTRAA